MTSTFCSYNSLSYNHKKQEIKYKYLNLGFWVDLRNISKWNLLHVFSARKPGQKTLLFLTSITIICLGRRRKCRKDIKCFGGLTSGQFRLSWGCYWINLEGKYNTLTKSPCLIVSLFIACSLLWKISLGVLNLPCELGKSELTPSNL